MLVVHPSLSGMGNLMNLWHDFEAIFLSRLAFTFYATILLIGAYIRISRLRGRVEAVRGGQCLSCGHEQQCEGCGALDPYGLVGEQRAQLLRARRNAPRPSPGLLRSNFGEYVRQYEVIHQVKLGWLGRAGVWLGIERDVVANGPQGASGGPQERNSAYESPDA
jgi:hypothetical protein